MAIFGKGKNPMAGAVLNPDVEHDLTAAARKQYTGAIEVVCRDSHAIGRLYLFDGGLYAVTLDGYTPRLAARLLSSGSIDDEQYDEMAATLGPAKLDRGAGAFVVGRGWVDADRLATYHQEYLLAALGALTSRPRVKTHSAKGETTADFCTLPLPVDPLFDTLRMRAGRLASGLGALSFTADPTTMVLERTQIAIPSDMTLREFTAMAEAVDDRASMLAAAWALGFTMAEAVHVSMLLERAGALRVSALASAPSWSQASLPVPEVFGVTDAGDAAGMAEIAVAQIAVAEVISEPEPVLEPDGIPEPEPVLEPEGIPEGEPVLDIEHAPEPMPAWEAVSEPDDEPPVSAFAAGLLAQGVVEQLREDEPDAVPEPEPEPEPEAEPMPEPESAVVPEPAPVVNAPPAPVAAATGDPHVLMLRREMALTEATDLETLLATVESEEREAVARANAVRSRLAAVRESIAWIDADLDEAQGERP